MVFPWQGNLSLGTLNYAVIQSRVKFSIVIMTLFYFFPLINVNLIDLQTCLLTWEMRVVGWDVSYGAEFVPSAEDSYTVIIQKARKVATTEEPVVSNSFKVGEPGKVVLTIDNTTSKKKKKLLYRLKTKPCSD